MRSSLGIFTIFFPIATLAQNRQTRDDTVNIGQITADESQFQTRMSKQRRIAKKNKSWFLFGIFCDRNVGLKPTNEWQYSQNWLAGARKLGGNRLLKKCNLCNCNMGLASWNGKWFGQKGDCSTLEMEIEGAPALLLKQINSAWG